MTAKDDSQKDAHDKPKNQLVAGMRRAGGPVPAPGIPNIMVVRGRAMRRSRGRPSAPPSRITIRWVDCAGPTDRIGTGMVHGGFR